MQRIAGIAGIVGLCCVIAGCSGRASSDAGGEPLSRSLERAGTASAQLAFGSIASPSQPGIRLFGVESERDVTTNFEAGDEIALGDVNNDGIDEVLRGRNFGNIAVFDPFGGQITFPAVTAINFSNEDQLAAGDINGDSFDEIIHGRAPIDGSRPNNGDVVIYPREGTVIGDFFQSDDNAANFPDFPFGSDIAVCDLDNDGFDEIILAPDWHIYSHPSRPAIPLATFFPGGLPPFLTDRGDRIVCADFNGDLFDDLVVVSAAESGSTNDTADLTFFSVPGATPVVFDPNNRPNFRLGGDIAAGDVTGDGVAEFAIGHIFDGASAGGLRIFDAAGNAVNDFLPRPESYFPGDSIYIGRATQNADLDSDDDGLLDSWELNGIDFDGDGCVDLDLPTLGANPLQRDVFVEIDAFDCTVAGDCLAGDTHGHMPTAASLAPVVAAFAAAPIINPNGTTGINLVIQLDETLPHQNVCDFNANINGCFDTVKDASFGTVAERAGSPCGSPGSAVLGAKSAAFHYNLWVHTMTNGASGISEGGDGTFGSNDFVVSLFNFAGLANGNAAQQAGTFMHELGHNLGLDHGGGDRINRKPNYLSVMNYEFQFGLLPAGGFDYSRALLPDLFEVGGAVSGLDETVGIQDGALQTRYYCPNGRVSIGAGTGAIDFNCVDADTDGIVDNELGFTSDVNNDRLCGLPGANSLLDTVPGGDDLRLGGAILPGPNGKLDSAILSLGPQGDDVVAGTLVLAGANNTLETAPASDDTIVNRLDPGANGTVDAIPLGDDVASSVIAAGVDGTLQSTPAVDDFVLLNQILAGPNGVLDTAPAAGTDDVILVLQVQPGANLILDSVPALDDVLTAALITPGPDGLLDSDLVSAGLLGDDLVNFNTVDPGLQFGDNIMQTQPARDDILAFQVVSDGVNRTCETTIAGDDTPPFDTPRGVGSLQAVQLTGFDDWGNLRHNFRGSRDFAPGVHLTVPPEAELTLQQSEEAALRETVADVSIALTTVNGQAAQGGELRYQLTLQNAGPFEAIGPSGNLLLPEGLELAECSPGPAGTCLVAGLLGVFNLETLAPGASAQAEFVVRPSCSFTGEVLAIARATTASFDPVLANNEATVSAEVVPSAPIFTRIPQSVTATRCVNLALGTAAARDVCGGTVSITNNAPATFPLGRTVVTWTAVNQAGKSTTATQLVTTSLGDDVSCCPAGLPVVLGTSNNNTLTGSSAAECILGRGGQDQINGGGGNDVISGGEGNDVVDGGAGNDRLFGGNGQDIVTGGIGDDQLEGGGGDDIVRGSAGTDTLRGGQGQDTLEGEDGFDTLFGEDGFDTLFGGSGDDQLDGGVATDTCTGGTGTNRFVSCESRPDAAGATDGCANTLIDGTETAPDCGGTCATCGTDLTCGVSSDCTSQVCSVGICLASQTPIVATLTVTTDWGGGYCATVNARNVNSVPSVDWAVLIDTRQTLISQTSNGTVNAATGKVLATPSGQHKIVQPAATNSKLSFCANRPAGSTALPEIVSSGGTF